MDDAWKFKQSEKRGRQYAALWDKRWKFLREPEKNKNLSEFLQTPPRFQFSVFLTG